MATRMIASAVKLSGDTMVARAMASAAIAPEIALLMKENDELRAQLDKERRKRWRENAIKMQELEAHLEKISEPVPWWRDALMLIGGALYLGVTGFVRLLIVREE